MSQTTDKPVTVVPSATAESNESTVEKVTFVQKAKTFVKNHKKSTIAVGALVGLVGLAAVTGKKVVDSEELSEPSEEAMEQARAELEALNIPVPTDV